MSLTHSTKIVTDGLVFYYDMSNTQKSWKGAPTTNFFTNGHFLNGQGILQESGSSPSNNVIYFPENPGETDYVLEQSMGSQYTEYQINLTTELLPSTTYVMSGWYAESPDYVCADGSRMFHSRAFSSSGAHVSLNVGLYNVLETIVIKGITWKYCYATITTPPDYSNLFNWYLGFGTSTYTGKRYYTNIQIEQGSFPSSFVNGTRSSTQALMDLVGANIVTVNNLTYNTDKTFSFNGSSSYIDCGNSNVLQQSSAITMSAWVNPVSASGLGNIMSKNYNSGYRFRLDSTNALWWYVSGNSVQGGNCPNNVWSNCVVTGDNSGLRAYVNGDLVSSNSVAFMPTDPIAGNLIIGSLGGAEYFNGQISSAKVYSRALTSAEVRQNFNAIRARYGV